MKHEHEHGHHHHKHRGGEGRGRGRRPFDYGDLRLLFLAMIAERPSHGYELIKAVEERMGGSYSPSPGVVYPTLAWLDDMGDAAVDAAAPGSGETGRKRYRVTPEGESFLATNREAADALLARGGAGGPGRDAVPAPVVRAFDSLKLALRLRLRHGAIPPDAAETIAAAIDAAVHAVERS